MNTERLSGSLFADMVRNGAANLYSNRDIVNDLNVFPIPDGDTGDNMYMTIDSGATSIADVDSLEKVASQVAQGMLLGARGNSGVILSRFFAGVASGFAGVDEADADVLGTAFSSGVKEAYSAVATPVEGTILTVFKDAAAFAKNNISGESTIDSYFDDFTNELRCSLQRTPDLLDVLKDAGVVDSGGAGFVYIADGMKMALNGELETVEHTSEKKKQIDVSAFTSDSVLEFGYCTEFLLRLQTSKCDLEKFDIKAFTDELNAIGDSVVAFADGTIVKVHIHSMTPGVVIDHCQKYGEFLTMKIENMMLQHSEVNIQNRFDIGKVKPKKRYGIVSVATGDGIKEVFTSLGTDVVVDGGQSMNPSAKDFIDAFEEINADYILVYPNNGNVILTAKQAAEMYGKCDIRVLPTHTVGEGYASLSMLDTECEDVDAVIENAKEVIDATVTGMVSLASRDAEMDGVSVKKNDFIGFSNDKIYVDSPERCEALLQLAEKLDCGKYDILLLVCGLDVAEAEAQKVYSELEKKYRRTEVIMVNGGQPIHDFILILE